MTQPIGTPDWQRTQPGASKVLYVNAAVSSPLIQTGPLFCGAFSAIAVYGKLTGHRWFIHPHFYDTFSQAVDLGPLQWVCEDGGTMLINIPVRAPWMNLAVGSTDNVTNETGIFSLIGHNSGTDASVMRNPQPILSVANQAIGASSSLALFATETIDGPGIWTVQTALASWSASLSSINFIGGSDTIARMGAGSGPPSLAVPLPSGCARIDFTNGTAAAGTFNASLYAGRS